MQTEQNAERLRMRFFLSLISLSLSGCLTMQNAPITKLYVVDTKNGKCGERVITNKETLASRWVQDLPLEQCNGHVSLTAKEFLDLRTYLKGGK